MNSLFLFIFFFSIVTGNKLENDRACLLEFVSGVTSDPGNVLQNWSNSSSVHVCNWTGITCNENRDSVLELDLSGASLRGSISPAIARLSRLTVLDLSRNFFEGSIPREVGYLSELKQLSLSSNLLRGKIPFELGFFQGLEYLDLGSNKLDGDIPMSLFCNGTSSLEYVDISNNSISGSIPLNGECDIKKLRYLLLWSNKLTGQVPRALSNSSKLKWLDFENNFFEGELPFEIVKNLSKLQFVYLSYNRFSSSLEPFFLALSNSPGLQELELAGNRLFGKIPDIIRNLPGTLVQLHLDDNQISGGIPPSISNLLNLTLLNLSSNSLNGSIPKELCHMEKLERLYLSDNILSGDIPPCFGNASKLGLLDLSKNRLSNLIPDTFSNVSQLRKLLLNNNKLVGTIPMSLSQCVNLETLDISHNQLSGFIPSDFARLSTLKMYLNISNNQLNGSLPPELSKMNMVLAMDLSSNNFSGAIPTQLGSCIALELLNLSGNALEGSLPDSIGKLPFLEKFDVSSNILSGKIPESFQKSSTLKHLNFSFNNFSGNVSFSVFDIDSFLGNPGLCSSSIAGLPMCKSSRRKRSIHLLVLLPVLVIATFLMSLIPVFLKSKSKSKNKFSKIFSQKIGYEEDEENESEEHNYPKISHQELVEATNGFNGSSLIGAGQFGQVYKGILKDNTKIAVKVISYAKSAKISESFNRECEVLKNTRHRNLIRIITICSRPDFKALVLPLMQNGSLEDHLYPSDHGLSHLDLVQMVRILSDVAEGLVYLHHYAPVKVAHCDLKPSNILLDDDMNAMLSDFGIARLVKEEVEKNMEADGSLLVSSTDGLLCGSIGYIAPEYGMGRRASTQGDVYSFGVLLLEMVTRKRPTDVVFNDGSSLHEWVKSHYPHNLEPIIKEALVNYTPVSSTMSCNTKLLHDMVQELIELGLICTQYNPSTRPTMLDVAHEMATWKEYLSSPSSLLKS